MGPLAATNAVTALRRTRRRFLRSDYERVEPGMIPRIWWPYVYQYGVGLIIFLIGVTLILRYRACDLRRRSDRFWFGVLIFGFVWYAGIHFLWYMAALYIMPAEAGS
ncbi:MAG: hypothetical protein D6744_11255 [Planctomycetota bacterium]|nr:MAG: hypothetical protein D6744_11255 [Planctomycetota bacterium]